MVTLTTIFNYVNKLKNKHKQSRQTVFNNSGVARGGPWPPIPKNYDDVERRTNNRLPDSYRVTKYSGFQDACVK